MAKTFYIEFWIICTMLTFNAIYLITDLSVLLYSKASTVANYSFQKNCLKIAIIRN